MPPYSCHDFSVEEIIPVIIFTAAIPISLFLSPSRNVSPRGIAFHHIYIFIMHNIIWHMGGVLNVLCLDNWVRDDGVISNIETSFFMSSGNAIFLISLFCIYSIDKDIKDTVITLFHSIILQISVALSVLAHNRDTRIFFVVLTFILPFGYLNHTIKENDRNNGPNVSRFLKFMLRMLVVYNYIYVTMVAISPSSLNYASYPFCKWFLSITDVVAVMYLCITIFSYGWSLTQPILSDINPGDITRSLSKKEKTLDQIVTELHTMN